MEEKIKQTGPKNESGNSAPYVAAVLVIFLALAFGSLVVVLRPDSDVVVVFGLVIGATAPTVAAIIAIIVNQETRKEARETRQVTNETYHAVNSRMTEMIAKVEALARAEGEKQGREESDARTDLLAEVKKDK